MKKLAIVFGICILLLTWAINLENISTVTGNSSIYIEESGPNKFKYGYTNSYDETDISKKNIYNKININENDEFVLFFTKYTSLSIKAEKQDYVLPVSYKIYGNDIFLYDFFSNYILIDLFETPLNFSYKNYKEIIDSNTSFISVDEYYSNDSSNYEEYSGKEAVLAYKGDVNLLDEKITYLNYVETNIKPEEKWISFFEKELKNLWGDFDSPIIITEAWLFNYNGNTAAVVNASNIIQVTNEQSFGSNNVIVNGRNIIYEASAVFYNNIGSLLINESQYTEIKGEKSNYYKFNIENGLETLMYFSKQYDSNNNIELFPVYVYPLFGSDRMYKRTPSFFIADIDSDNIIEIVCYHDWYITDLSSVTIYEIKNGKIDIQLSY